MPNLLAVFFWISRGLWFHSSSVHQFGSHWNLMQRFSPLKITFCHCLFVSLHSLFFQRIGLLQVMRESLEACKGEPWCRVFPRLHALAVARPTVSKQWAYGVFSYLRVLRVCSMLCWQCSPQQQVMISEWGLTYLVRDGKEPKILGSCWVRVLLWRGLILLGFWVLCH